MNKRCGAYLIFRATSVVLVRGQRLFEGGTYNFEHCTRQIYFFYVFIQRYPFYLLIFLLTDTKLIVNLELQEKFKRWKKNREFHDNESENISGESIGGVALINFFVPLMQCSIEGGTYSSNKVLL